MTTNKVIYESGATSHAVNDLILFTDHTRELAEQRDEIYKDWAETGNFGTTKLYERFLPLFHKAKNQYIKEFKHDKDSYRHIQFMVHDECIEYCNLYVVDFNTWKKENGYSK